MTHKSPSAVPEDSEISVYVHWPFCLSLCPYCDFNSHIYKTIDEELWLDSYKKEINFFAFALKHKRIKSIFFGGGTPSLMPPSLVIGIIDKLASLALLDNDTEITLEANPTSYEGSKFRAFKDAGINRVSIGVQSLNDADLHKLGRKHSVSEAMEVIKSAASLFDNFSFDLIYARSGQSVQAWQIELRRALEFARDHISLYQLTIEKGTEFFAMHKAGKLILPKDDDSARMYEITEEELDKKGFHRYEISNYAKAEYVSGEIDSTNIEQNYCQHNMTYWRYGEYLGIGPGAHSRLHESASYVDKERHGNGRGGKAVEAIMMYHKPDKWISAVQDLGHGTQSRNYLRDGEIAEELVMMALRLSEGLYDKRLQGVTGKSIKEVIDVDLARSYQKAGFLEIGDHIPAPHSLSATSSKPTIENIRLTDSGLLMHSYITSRLLKNN